MARACGVLVHDGRVLLQRKRKESIWAVPGGKIEGAETPEAALVREWMEELGETAVIGRLLWVFENRFRHEGAEVVQTEYYFEVAARGVETRAVDDTLEFAWFTCEELKAVDFRPAMVRESLFTLLAV